MKELVNIPRPETLANSPYLGIVIIAIIVALLITVSIHRKRYLSQLQNLFRTKERIMTYDSETTAVWANILFWLTILSIYGLFAYATLTMIAQQPFSLHYAAIALAGIALFIGIRTAVQWIIGYTFRMESIASQFISTNFIINALLALGLLPVTTALIYAMPEQQQWALISVAVLYPISLILITIKLLQFFHNSIRSIVYIFLYLCTIEILPLAVFLKLALSLTK